MKKDLEAASRFVEFGRRNKENGSRESISGPGSSMNSTTSVRNYLDSIIPRLKINRILDLGCGDWNWMQHCNFRSMSVNSNFQYHGWESNADLVKELSEKFGGPGFEFCLKDVTYNRYPEVDLIIARDILFHLSKENVLKVIEKAMNSGRYFLATSYNEYLESYHREQYIDIDNWGFGCLNLEQPEFGLCDYCVDRVEEAGVFTAGQKRFVNLYDFRKYKIRKSKN